MSDSAAAVVSGDSSSELTEPREILRFHKSERQMHWSTAIPFMVCYTTALILVTVYNPNPARPFRWVVSWTHRTSGLCLFLGPLSTIVRHRRDIRLHRDNVARVWRWTRDDLKWLSLIGPASFSSKVSLPHQGKFNAVEKINFLVLTATYPMYVMTGVAIWSGVGAYPAWMIHFCLASLATPLIFGHIMMATVNPDTRPGLTGMLTGFVDREWANHHYHLWYREHHGGSGIGHRESGIGSRKASDAPGVIEPVAVPLPVAAGPCAHTGAAGLTGRNWLACLDCVRRHEREGAGGRGDRARCLPCAIEAGARVAE